MIKHLALVVQQFFFVAMGIFGIGFLICFHEFGHFLFGKLFNAAMPSFSIGFGPRLLTKKIGETEFSISAIPLGGYVEFTQDEDASNTPSAQGLVKRSITRKPWYQKMLIMCGGIAFNMILAYVLVCILFLIGVPKTSLLYPRNATNTISVVVPDSPAAQAGLEVGDTILAANGKALASPADIQLFTESIIKEAPLTPFTLLIKRADGSEKTMSVTTTEKMVFGKRVGMLGIVFDMHDMQPMSFTHALSEGIRLTNQLVKNTIYGFKHIISKRDISQVGGPVMLISQTIAGASKGFKIFLLLLALISVNLAILNLIPLPILDGGQMLFFTIEALFRKPLPVIVRWYIHLGTWLCFMVLVLYLSIMDIARIANPYIEQLMTFFGFGK